MMCVGADGNQSYCREVIVLDKGEPKPTLQSYVASSTYIERK